MGEKYLYNAEGQIIGIDESPVPKTSSVEHSTGYQYDEKGRIVDIQAPKPNIEIPKPKDKSRDARHGIGPLTPERIEELRMLGSPLADQLIPESTEDYDRRQETERLAALAEQQSRIRQIDAEIAAQPKGSTIPRDRRNDVVLERPVDPRILALSQNKQPIVIKPKSETTGWASDLPPQPQKGKLQTWWDRLNGK